PPTSTLFPYTTLFRSSRRSGLPVRRGLQHKQDRLTLAVAALAGAKQGGRLEDRTRIGLGGAAKLHDNGAARRLRLFEKLVCDLRSEEHTSELQSRENL